MTDSIPKSEPIEFDFESEILQLCFQYPNGISDKILQNSFPNITSQQRVSAINHLLSIVKIDLLRSSSDPKAFLYRIKDTINKQDDKTTDQREKIVYQLIENSGNTGISIREIKFKTQLAMPALNKILKSLESKNLIKAIKSIQANRRKIYTLYELTPDVSLTGDIWICNGELDEELIRVLTDQCLNLLNDRKDIPNNSFISSADLVSLINDMGFTTIKLTVQHIESILYLLVCDGKIEKRIVTDTNGLKKNVYKSIKSIINSTPIVRNPCGICPVFNDCHPEGIITPSTCIYLNKWLDF